MVNPLIKENLLAHYYPKTIQSAHERGIVIVRTIRACCNWLLPNIKNILDDPFNKLYWINSDNDYLVCK